MLELCKSNRAQKWYILKDMQWEFSCVHLDCQKLQNYSHTKNEITFCLHCCIGMIFLFTSFLLVTSQDAAFFKNYFSWECRIVFILNEATLKKWLLTIVISQNNKTHSACNPWIIVWYIKYIQLHSQSDYSFELPK